jgi:hypothetical protein
MLLIYWSSKVRDNKSFLIENKSNRPAGHENQGQLGIKTEEI